MYCMSSLAPLVGVSRLQLQITNIPLISDTVHCSLNLDNARQLHKSQLYITQSKTILNMDYGESPQTWDSSYQENSDTVDSL